MSDEASVLEHESPSTQRKIGHGTNTIFATFPADRLFMPFALEIRAIHDMAGCLSEQASCSVQRSQRRQVPMYLVRYQALSLRL